MTLEVHDIGVERDEETPRRSELEASEIGHHEERHAVPVATAGERTEPVDDLVTLLAGGELGAVPEVVVTGRRADRQAGTRRPVCSAMMRTSVSTTSPSVSALASSTRTVRRPRPWQRT